MSRESKMVGTIDPQSAKSVGILNAYGEIATLSPQDVEMGGGISSQALLFHGNMRKQGTQSSHLHSATSPKTTASGTVMATDGFMPLSPNVALAPGMIQLDQGAGPGRRRTPRAQSKKLPTYRSSHAAIQRTHRSKQRTNEPLFCDGLLAANSNYMNVIKESHESILLRTSLKN